MRATYLVYFRLSTCLLKCKVSYLLAPRDFCEDIFSSSLKKLYLCRDIHYYLTFAYDSYAESVSSNQCLCHAKWAGGRHLGVADAVCHGGEFYLWGALDGKPNDAALYAHNAIFADKEVSHDGGSDRGVYYHAGLPTHALDHGLCLNMGGYRRVCLLVVF